MNKRSKGSEQEEKAAKYLESQGYIIELQNFYCRFGEIDIVARDGSYLVFVEVKYRADQGSGLPEEAVGYGKQKRIYNCGRYYLYKNYPDEAPDCRFDVVAIEGEEIRLYKNAFGGF